MLCHPKAFEGKRHLNDLMFGIEEVYWQKLKAVCGKLDAIDFEGVLSADLAVAGEIVDLVHFSQSPDWQIASECARLVRSYQFNAAREYVDNFRKPWPMKDWS
jgi:hypothetical protein